MPHAVSQEMRDCIQQCLSCHAICLETVQHCLGMGGEHSAAPHISMMLVCADICQTSANAMLLGSELHNKTCAACAEICHRCYQDCEQMAAGDETMIQCAEACRKCAASCEQMAGALR